MEVNQAVRRNRWGFLVTVALFALCDLAAPGSTLLRVASGHVTMRYAASPYLADSKVGQTFDERQADSQVGRHS